MRRWRLSLEPWGGVWAAGGMGWDVESSVGRGWASPWVVGSSLGLGWVTGQSWVNIVHVYKYGQGVRVTFGWTWLDAVEAEGEFSRG